jgi:hypothetical protein
MRTSTLHGMRLGLLGLLLTACVNAPEAETFPPVACDLPATGLPTDLYCTGLYAKRGSQQIARQVMAYTPGVTLWSDGADKQRYLYLPQGATIDTADLDAWHFPVGTRAWKQFKVDGKLVETRIFWKREATKWESGTYVWDGSQTAATLNTEPKGIILANGYEIPTLKDCGKCHHGASDGLLGVEAVALGLPNAKGATLTTLAKKGWLSQPPATTTIALPQDDTGKASEPLGYLHANCGMPCHSTRGLGEETKLVLRLRAGEFWPQGGSGAVHAVVASETDIWKATVHQPPTTAAVAQKFPGAQRIVPGAHDQSLLWLVSHLRGNYQMPPLVSHKVDEVGMQKLADWIDALPK